MEKYFCYELVNQKNLGLKKSLQGESINQEELKNQFILDFLPMVNEIIWVWSENLGWGKKEEDFYTSEITLRACEMIKTSKSWIPTRYLVRSLEGYLQHLLDGDEGKPEVVSLLGIDVSPEDPGYQLDSEGLFLIESYLGKVIPAFRRDFLIRRLLLEAPYEDLIPRFGLLSRSSAYSLMEGIKRKLDSERKKETKEYKSLRNKLWNLK